MSDNETHDIFSDIEERYQNRTVKSAEHNARAKHRLPGGDTRTATFYRPYPANMTRGKSCYLYDADGNEYIDMLNNYTSLIHGHAHPNVMQAVREQLESGSVFGSATEIQYIHAEHLCNRVPSLEQVRYGNSGTEGTMFVMRAARAFTTERLAQPLTFDFGSFELVESISDRGDLRYLPLKQ